MIIRVVSIICTLDLFPMQLTPLLINMKPEAIEPCKR